MRHGFFREQCQRIHELISEKKWIIVNGERLREAMETEGRIYLHILEEILCDKEWGIIAGSMWVETCYPWSIDAANLPYDDDFFDAVYDSFTMEFIPEKEQYVKEFAGVLKPQGLFFILTSIPPSRHCVDPERLVKILKTDFEILETDNPSETSLSIVANRKWPCLAVY
jgi:SAM-dependent methyltransferase